MVFACFCRGPFGLPWTELGVCILHHFAFASCRMKGTLLSKTKRAFLSVVDV